MSYFFETYGMENSEPILKNSNNTYERINTFVCNNDEITNRIFYNQKFYKYCHNRHHGLSNN